MNRRVFSISLFALLAFVFAACKPKPIVDEKAVFAAIRENLAAMQNKDVAGVMATIHPDCPLFASTKDAIADIFKNYQLRFTLNELKIVSATPEEVKVSFVQRTDNLTDPAQTQSTIAEGVHTLRKDHGKWKIFDTVTGKSEIVPATPPPGAPTSASPLPTSPAPALLEATPMPPTPKPATPLPAPAPTN